MTATGIPDDGDRHRQSFDTIVFDVLGTTVDETGTVRAEVAAALPAPEAEELAIEWMRRLTDEVTRISAGEATWRSNDELRGETLRAVLADRRHLDPGDRLVERLAGVGHRLRPWPDSADALNRLRSRYRVVALSNADAAQLADISVGGDLSWHLVLAGSMIRAAKPDPRVYRFALDQLAADPAHTLFVACHPWDLRGAAAFGMHTAYVARPGELAPAPSDRFDLRAEGLAGLVEQLCGDTVPS